MMIYLYVGHDHVGRLQVRETDGSDANLETHMTDIELAISNRGEEATSGECNKIIYNYMIIIIIFLLKYLEDF